MVNYYNSILEPPEDEYSSRDTKGSSVADGYGEGSGSADGYGDQLYNGFTFGFGSGNGKGYYYKNSSGRGDGHGKSDILLFQF